MTPTSDVQRLASSISLGVLLTVMVGSGGLTLLSRTTWWCEQEARAEVEAVQAVALAHFPEADLVGKPQFSCDDGARASVRTEVPTTSTAEVQQQLTEAGWSTLGDHLHSPDGEWEATVTRTDDAVRVLLSSREG